MRAVLFGLIGAVLIALLAWFLQRRNPAPPIVLGKEMAAAERAEQTRLAAGTATPSPLPAELRYELAAGDLTHPAWHPLDDAIRDLGDRYAKGDSGERAGIRNSLSKSDFYTLITFSRRSAVFALRTRDPHRLADGLNALAMIEAERVDVRDVHSDLGLLLAIGHEIGANPGELFGKAAAVAEPSLAKVMLGFPTRPRDQWNLKSWLFAIVQTDAGPGLVRREIENYEPTLPLDQVALALAELLRADKYEADVTLATGMPAIWLSGIDDRAQKRALASVRAGATIQGTLRPMESPDAAAQMLVVFLAELGNESASEDLFRLFEERRQRKNNSFAIAGAQQGRLFSLAVARSFQMGKASFETQSSMDRFSPAMAEVLKRFIPGSR